MNLTSLDAYRVKRDDYVKGELINKGTIGNVYQGVWKTVTKDIPVAVKFFL